MKNYLLYPFLIAFLIFNSIVLSFSQALDTNNIENLQRPKIGLVLSGGGSKGLTHIGTIMALEELGIKPDYIAATSMGSLVGGLYASGMSPDSIVICVKDMFSSNFYRDVQYRNDYSFEDKQYADKMFVPLPIQSGNFRLPGGLVEGYTLSLLLNKYFWRTHTVEQFDSLPIPFLCVGADLQSGEYVILDSGSLANAVRISISIPSVFTPVQYMGRTFVDGGLFNNFPVMEVKDMGADIIIGNNTGFKSYNAEELKSVQNITEQAVFIHVVKYNDRVKKECDFLFEPDVKNFPAVPDLDEIDSLVRVGYLETMKQKDELLKLIDSVNSFGEYIRPNKLLKTQDKILVSGYIFEGNKNTKESQILAKLKINFPSYIDEKTMESSIKRLYGTQIFSLIKYSFVPSGDSILLRLDCKENPQEMFRIGMRYDNYNQSNMIINLRFSNYLINGSKLNVDGVLGSNPRVKTTCFISTGINPNKLNKTHLWKADFGLVLDYSSQSQYRYTDAKRNAAFNQRNLSLKYYTQTVKNDWIAYGVGAELQILALDGRINPLLKDYTDFSLFNLFFYINRDSFNKTVFPTKGSELKFKIIYATDLLGDIDMHKSLQSYFKYKVSIPVSESTTIFLGTDVGMSFLTHPIGPLCYYVGGINNTYYDNYFSYYGLEFMEKRYEQFVGFNLKLQQQLYKKLYATAGVSSIMGGVEYSNMLDFSVAESGFGLSLAYKTPIGPIEFSYSKSLNRRKNIFSFVIGYEL